MLFGGVTALLSLGCGGASEEAPPSLDCAQPQTREVQNTLCAPWYDAFSVEPDRGLSWERDPEFLIAGHTVPTLLVLPGDEGFRMVTTGKERGTLHLHVSEDGLEWKQQKEPFFHRKTMPAECGKMPLDVAFSYMPDGSVRMIVEGWKSEHALGPTPMEGDPGPAPMALCSFMSRDGKEWIHEKGAWVLKTMGNAWPSVLDVSWDAVSGTHRMYYVDTHPEVDGIRLAVSPDGAEYTPTQAERLLERAHVDPNPIRLRDGSGWRLYHTHDALKGALGFVDSKSGLDFEAEDKGLAGLSGQACYTPPNLPSPPDACLYDPAFLRLPGGRLVMYYGIFETTEDRVDRIGIGRAFATD